MPFYKIIDQKSPVGQRTIAGLLRLKQALDKKLPSKTIDQTLMLASWNIREFGGKKSGGRKYEDLFYIAEILSRFDLIAMQEVRDNLDAFDSLMRILGRWWKYLVSDVTFGRQGNSERLAFIYDSRKILFGGLAGELVPPAEGKKRPFKSEFAFARTPYLAGFQAGWFKFTVCTQHAYYGESKPDDPQRQKELEAIVELLRKRMKSEDRWANNVILLGDFNIFSTKDKTFLAIEKGGFEIPAKIKGQYTNAGLDKPFDQIAFLAPDMKRQVEIAKAGVFPFFEYVYRNEDRATYLQGKSEPTYRQWRTYKMSDHLPLWVELKVDFGIDYLSRKVR